MFERATFSFWECVSLLVLPYPLHRCILTWFASLPLPSTFSDRIDMRTCPLCCALPYIIVGMFLSPAYCFIFSYVSNSSTLAVTTPFPFSVNFPLCVAVNISPFVSSPFTITSVYVSHCGLVVCRSTTMVTSLFVLLSFHLHLTSIVCSHQCCLP